MRTMSIRLSAGMLAGLCAFHALAAPPPSTPSTGWHDGCFHINVAGVLHRSNIFLGRPNTDASEAMPLGNGRLGAAVWAACGLTAQLNRADTLPNRLSPGV
jgi:alpha-L-fucosidase 2